MSIKVGFVVDVFLDKMMAMLLHVFTPRFLCLIQAVGICHQAEERQVYTVRVKDLARIVGEGDARIQYICQRSGASVGVMTDTTSMRHHTAYIEVTGTRAQVTRARGMIEEAIREVYDENAARLAMTAEYLQYDSIRIPFPKAAYFVRDTDLIDIESQSTTWIEVDISRPPRAGEPRKMQVLFCGTRRSINQAIRLIRQRVEQAREPEGPLVVDRTLSCLWARACAACTCIRN